MFDLTLATLHHIFILGLFAYFFAELVTIRAGMDKASVKRLTGLDRNYGIASGLILIVGFARAIFAAKGWDYYSHNIFFWAKIGTFIAIGLLSIPPTLTYLKWRRQGTIPSEHEVAKVRRYLWMELALFPLLPFFAAAMARGYGYFG